MEDLWFNSLCNTPKRYDYDINTGFQNQSTVRLHDVEDEDHPWFFNSNLTVLPEIQMKILDSPTT